MVGTARRDSLEVKGPEVGLGKQMRAQNKEIYKDKKEKGCWGPGRGDSIPISPG